MLFVGIEHVAVIDGIQCGLGTVGEVCAAEHKDVAEALSKHGQNIHTLLYDTVSKWGGSFRCSHHPLIRDSELD